MPVEVGDGLLEAEEVVHGADDDVDGGGVASLGAEVVLEVEVVPLADQLQEVEERDGQVEVGKDLAHGCIYVHAWHTHTHTQMRWLFKQGSAHVAAANTQTFSMCDVRLVETLIHVPIQDAAGRDQLGNTHKKANIHAFQFHQHFLKDWNFKTGREQFVRYSHSNARTSWMRRFPSFSSAIPSSRVE